MVVKIWDMYIIRWRIENKNVYIFVICIKLEYSLKLRRGLGSWGEEKNKYYYYIVIN